MKKPAHLSNDERTEEADKVSSRIAEIALRFHLMSIYSIYRKLFQGIYTHSGKMRDYNITKPGKRF